MNRDQLKRELNNFGLKANKVLGQNFLYSESVVSDMVEAAELENSDTVLEVGPGLGILTEEIAKKKCKILAVEKDQNLISYLDSKFRDNKNIEIINQDILKLQTTNYQLKDYKIIANLPFYLTSRFIRVFLEKKEKPSVMVLLMQKEVAERIVATNKNRSILSVSCELYSKAEIIREVSNRSFYPKPNVDCAVIKFDVFKELKYDIKNIELFFRIVKAGFSARRKQIHNNLSNGLKIESNKTKEILKKTNIDFTRRAQTLSLAEWHELYKEIKQN